jgi:hypothetical protein
MAAHCREPFGDVHIRPLLVHPVSGPPAAERSQQLRMRLWPRAQGISTMNNLKRPAACLALARMPAHRR